MVKATGQLFIVSAPSGAGKTSLVKALVAALSDIEVSVSHTTRAQRADERPGVDYHFSDVDAFKKIVEQAGFLEHATVFGNYYGTSKSLVSKALDSGVDVILEIDWQGAQQVRKTLAGSCSVFILPPSKAVLEDRLRGRGQDSDDIIEKRMRVAVDEMSHYKEYDYLVVNDDFELALQELRSIVQSHRLNVNRSQVLHADLIGQLLK
ncbi:MAG: guanylate kinase [Cycloclasticus sp.]|nr:guanylate kinase [Cycloclasticus sp.]MBQ0789733.1 guanylate kinase [Cycloclasticus sp.]